MQVRPHAPGSPVAPGPPGTGTERGTGLAAARSAAGLPEGPRGTPGYRPAVSWLGHQPACSEQPRPQLRSPAPAPAPPPYPALPAAVAGHPGFVPGRGARPCSGSWGWQETSLPLTGLCPWACRARENSASRTDCEPRPHPGPWSFCPVSGSSSSPWMGRAAWAGTATGPCRGGQTPERAVDDLGLKSEGRLWSDRFAQLARLRCLDGRGLFLSLCSLALDEASRERGRKWLLPLTVAVTVTGETVPGPSAGPRTCPPPITAA